MDWTIATEEECYCEHVNEPSGCIKCWEILEYPRECWLLKDSSPWSWLRSWFHWLLSESDLERHIWPWIIYFRWRVRVLVISMQWFPVPSCRRDIFTSYCTSRQTPSKWSISGKWWKAWSESKDETQTALASIGDWTWNTWNNDHCI
jgi:hypothetical protein